MTSIELKTNRKRLGLTQQQFAGMIGYSRQSVSSWEKDEYDVPKVIALVITLMLKL